MKSMTGYARREGERDGAYLLIELKSYNNRYLDIHLNVPVALSGLEGRIRSAIGKRVGRGKVECSLRFRPRDESSGVVFDPAAVSAVTAALKGLRDQLGSEEEVHLSHVLRYDEAIRGDSAIDLDRVWKTVEPELRDALDDLEQERVREGSLTREAVEVQLDVVRDTLEIFAKGADELETSIRDRVRAKFDEVLGARIEEDRVLAEIASLLLKFSIDEEIVRLGGHIEAFSSLLRSEGPVGKRLDFLCQELNREVNTIGSKSPIYRINSQVVEAKDAIEKMREQLRNVE